jgi:hypothetical protein
VRTDLDACGGSHAADALALRRRQDDGDVVYGRARRDGEGRLWLQYWSFFYYVDRGFLGLDQHEGDWRVFQIRLDAQGRPDAATFVRHSDAHCLSWQQVEPAGSADGPVAVVRPARGSRSPLPRSGSFAAPVVPDHNDGHGPLVRPRLETTGDSVTGGHLPAVALRARREADLAEVAYSFSGADRAGDEPVRIVAAPVDAAGEVGVARSYPVDDRQGSLAIQLPAEREWSGVRACAVSALGVSGECRDAAFTGQK